MKSQNRRNYVRVLWKSFHAANIFYLLTSAGTRPSSSMTPASSGLILILHETTFITVKALDSMVKITWGLASQLGKLASWSRTWKLRVVLSKLVGISNAPCSFWPFLLVYKTSRHSWKVFFPRWHPGRPYSRSWTSQIPWRALPGVVNLLDWRAGCHFECTPQTCDGILAVRLRDWCLRSRALNTATPGASRGTLSSLTPSMGRMQVPFPALALTQNNRRSSILHLLSSRGQGGRDIAHGNSARQTARMTWA